MRLEWIEDILAIHDAGSLRAAADMRFLTASAFTRRIKSVENSIGNEIIDRDNKPVTLKPHVVELIPRMREAQANLRNIKQELTGLSYNARTSRLICQHTLTVSWAPRVVRTLTKDQSQLRIRSGTKDECALSILKNDVDIALVYEEPDAIIKTEDDPFKRAFLGHEEFLPVAALAANAELAQLINVKTIPLVIYPRSLFLGEMLEKALSRQPSEEYSCATIAEAGLGPAVMEFVREGLGVGWLPHSLIQDALASGELTSMTALLPSFHLNVTAISSKSAKSPPKERLWDAIKEEFST